MNVTIYSKDPCPFCDMAKTWFKSKGIEFTENKLGVNCTKEQLLEAAPGARTVPQIVINGELVGGWDDLQKHSVFTDRS